VEVAQWRAALCEVLKQNRVVVCENKRFVKRYKKVVVDVKCVVVVRRR